MVDDTEETTEGLEEDTKKDAEGKPEESEDLKE